MSALVAVFDRFGFALKKTAVNRKSLLKDVRTSAGFSSQTRFETRLINCSLINANSTNERSKKYLLIDVKLDFLGGINMFLCINNQKALI